MVILLKSQATDEGIKKAAEDLDSYIKIVVDLHRQVMTIGGLRHYQGEELLLADGSHPADLWGGAVDLTTREIDYGSMINVRPPANPNRDLVLNIAVNLDRLSRWAQEGKTTCIPQFLTDTQTYIDQINLISPKFRPTYERFLKDYAYLKSTPPDNHNWADTAFTWAAILTHRAKLV